MLEDTFKRTYNTRERDLFVMISEILFRSIDVVRPFVIDGRRVFGMEAIFGYR